MQKFERSNNSKVYINLKKYSGNIGNLLIIIYQLTKFEAPSYNIFETQRDITPKGK